MSRPKRSCGDCTLCCFVKSVKLEDGRQLTPVGEWCQFCSPPDGGCDIYGIRPLACRTYACGWLQGFGEENHRPDISGLMIDATLTEQGPALMFIEHPEGSMMSNPLAQDAKSWVFRNRERITLRMGGMDEDAPSDSAPAD